MLHAHGEESPDVSARAGDYDDFYKKAFADIAEKIKNKASPLLLQYCFRGVRLGIIHKILQKRNAVKEIARTFVETESCSREET